MEVCALLSHLSVVLVIIWTHVHLHRSDFICELLEERAMLEMILGNASKQDKRNTDRNRAQLTALLEDIKNSQSEVMAELELLRKDDLKVYMYSVCHLAAHILIVLSYRLQKVHTLDIAPLRSKSPPQKRSGMAHVLKGSHSFTCTPTRSSAIGMSHTCLYNYESNSIRLQFDRVISTYLTTVGLPVCGLLHCSLN